MQTKTLSAVFETYFRILKHTMQSIARCVFLSHVLLYYYEIWTFMSWIYISICSHLKTYLTLLFNECNSIHPLTLKSAIFYLLMDPIVTTKCVFIDYLH